MRSILTDREPVVDPPATFDTVGVAVPVRDFDRLGCEVSISNYGSDQAQYRYSRRLAGGGFVSTGVGHVAWIEASLPKRADPEQSNVVALPVGQALDVLRDLVDEASGFLDVERGHLFEESRLVRLDLVRDFQGVTRQTELLDGLATVKQDGRSKVRRFADPTANRAETLRIGPRAWGCTLYDKHTETGGKAPVGHVRFEARLHRDQMVSVFARKNGGHLRCVGDLVRVGLEGDNDGGRSLRVLQRAWFDRVNFGAAVPASSTLADALAGAGLTPAVAAGLWAYLTLPGWRVNCSAPTERRYRRLAQSLGFTPVLDALDSSRGELVRLDYATGRQVVELRAA